VPRANLVGVGVVAVAVVVGGFFGLGRTTPAPATSTAGFEVVTTRAAEVIRVHVGGWVMERSVVVLPAGSLVADAIRAAGGARPGAELDALNLALPLQDGSQVIVPGPGSAGTPAAGSGSGVVGDGRVRINVASAAELETLPGVGPVLAGRIVAHREQHGPFRSAEDLLSVPGIGEAKYAALRDLVVVP
jgi:competence protein ComEA